MVRTEINFGLQQQWEAGAGSLRWGRFFLLHRPEPVLFTDRQLSTTVSVLGIWLLND